MSKTILCVLLKVLILAKAVVMSKYPDSDSIQDIPVSENDSSFTTSHLDSVSVRNKTDEIPFANMSVISESIESILSKPTSPRAFVEFHNGFLNEEDNISVTFRWNQPEFTEGVIQGYIVQCWFIENQKKIQICDNKSISATILECTVHNLKPNTTYFFRVQAHTIVGAGPYTDLIDVSTMHENPIPQLLMISKDGIHIWDLDSNINVSLVKQNNVVDATYSIAEHKIYWSNNIKELMMLDMNEKKITKITQFQSIVTHLCIDWVARNLYCTEIFSEHVKKLDLTMGKNGTLNYTMILKNEFTYTNIKLNILPSLGCLTPDKKDYKVEEEMATANSIIINLPEPVSKSGCKRYNLPTTLYTIYVSYCLDNELNKFDNFTRQTYERFYKIPNLTPLTDYKLQLTLSNFYSDRLSMDLLFGSEVILRTESGKLNAPENVTVEALTPTIAAVYWMPPKKLNCVPVIYKVVYLILINNTQISEFLLIDKTKHTIGNKFFTIIEPLIPGQKYSVYVRIYPLNYSKLHTDSLTKTLYMYSEPNNITLNEVSINGMNMSWIPSVNMVHYLLEYKNVEMHQWQIANNSEPNNGGKVMYYIKNLLPGTPYEFRLILRYSKYQKDFIWPSDGRFTFSTLTSDISNSPGIYSVVTQYCQYIISSLVAMVIVIFICCYYRQRKKSNEQGLPPTMSDIKLETLHEIPNVSNVQLNTLYSPMLEYNSDKYALSEIKREEIRLEKLLGCGAFGMVYQGKVKNLKRSDIEISVAIKMLKKNASSQEKKKFLEEAKLMNHFRHKYVLRLLAVCLDEDSPLIVLELMETVDLLQYLRDSRKLQPSDSHALRLQDLFAICENVARGCRYLEDLRFVHRDLACRNCLVSARDRENRVVKIGGFGLARDVYKDYYYSIVNTITVKK